MNVSVNEKEEVIIQNVEPYPYLHHIPDMGSIIAICSKNGIPIYLVFFNNLNKRKKQVNKS